MFRHLFFILLVVGFSHNSVAQNENYFLIDQEVDTASMGKRDKKFLNEALTGYHKSKDPVSKLYHLSDLLDQLFDERYWVAYTDLFHQEVLDAIEKNSNSKNDDTLQFYLATALLDKGYYTDVVGNYNESRVLYRRAFKIYNELGNEGYSSTCMNNIGFTFKEEGDLDSALYYFKQSLNYDKGNDDEHAVHYNNIGYIYDLKGDLMAAYEYYDKAREIQEANTGHKESLPTTITNLSVILLTLGDTAQALKYYDRAIEINKELGSNIGLANNYLAKSIVLQLGGNMDEAKKLNWMSIQICREIGNYLDLGESYIEYANLLSLTNRMDSSFYYLNLVIEDTSYHGYPAIMTDAYHQMAVNYLESNSLEQALKFGLKAYDLSYKAEDSDNQSGTNQTLYKIYAKKGNYKKAFEHFQAFIELEKSSQNMSNQRKILSREYQQKLILQKEKDSLNASLAEERANKELVEKDLEITKSRNQLFYLSGAGIFALIVIFLLYRNNRQKQRDKEVILSQKEEISIERDKANANFKIAEEKKEQLEERNKEILDSIKYAKRLQEAVLPPQKLVKEWLTNSFILYKPKEIVSGDFYWMETTSIKEGDLSTNITFFAAADCTGHGVPGAMVSVICAGALNRAVNEYKLSDVGQILNKVSEIVVESFKQSGERVADGMDIALCGLDIGRKKLFFTGANNPLWIITENSRLNTGADFRSFQVEDYPSRFLHEIKGTKKHIGLNDNEEDFKTNEIQLQPGDGIFIFSDGLADQFGGSRGKKFKYQQFREILLQNFDKSMEELRNIINNKFEDWKGDMEQVDHICVIGVKINGKERNNFTKREIEVLEYLLEGLPSKLIADKMHISVHTVDTYRRRLLAKTNTYNSTELINYCKSKEIV